VLAMRRRTWPSMTPQGSLRSKFCPMSKKTRGWSSWCDQWPGLVARASTDAGCSRTTTAPTVTSSGEKQAAQWVESQTNKGIPAPNQWQSGADHQNALKRMGVRNGVRELR